MDLEDKHTKYLSITNNGHIIYQEVPDKSARDSNFEKTSSF